MIFGTRQSCLSLIVTVPLLVAVLGIVTIPASASAACGSFGNPPGTAPVCNYWKCTPDGWIAWPYAAGTLCTVGGQSGVCDGGVIIQGQIEPEQSGRCMLISTLRVSGNYSIAGVWYAVPGSGSATTYSNQSQTGTTRIDSTGSGDTFAVGVSNEAKFLGLIGGAYDVSYSRTWSQAATDSVDTLVTWKTDNTIPGPGGESFDHNYDQIVLELGPEFVFTGYTVDGTLTKLEWALDSSRSTLYPIELGFLNGAWSTWDTTPANIRNQLSAHGITAADIPQLLAVDPYAYDPSGSSQPDPVRFECVSQMYYIPGNPNTQTNLISNTYTSAHTDAAAHNYSVKLALAGTWLHQKLNASNTWSWSDSSSTTNTSTSSVSMQVSLHQPSQGYLGPTIVYAYVDKIYKTLMYSFLAPTVPNSYCQ